MEEQKKLQETHNADLIAVIIFLQICQGFFQVSFCFHSMAGKSKIGQKIVLYNSLFHTSSTYKFERQNFRYGRRNEPKFGTHVRIDTLTLKK